MITLGTQQVGKAYLGEQPVNKIMLGAIEVFPNVGNAPAWTPADLPSLLSWFDLSDLSTMFQDSAGTIPVTASGQPVGRINDKSGNGFDLQQATATARPQFQIVGGVYSIVGDGVDDALFGTLASELLPPWEFWIAAQMDTNGGINTGLFGVAPSSSGGSTGVRTGGLFQRSDGSIRQLAAAIRVGGNANNSTSISGLPVIGEPFILRGASGVSPDSLMVESGELNNSSVPVYGAANGTNAQRIFQASAGGQPRAFQCVSTSAPLSAQDAANLAAYLASKAGIAP